MTTDPTKSGNSDLFYNELEPFYEFGKFVELGAYVPLPDDWIAMLTDVQGSTRAIEAGLYKNVNMVGAASITPSSTSAVTSKYRLYSVATGERSSYPARCAKLPAMHSSVSGRCRRRPSV